MFQTYEAPEGGQDLAERIARLRGLMAKAGLDAVLVPRADEHQGEYVAPSAERLKWLTGFSGSAGLAVVARAAAALFVDGRYVAQAPTQVDTRIFEVLQIPDAKLSDWLGKHLEAGAVVGFDPWLHTAAMIEELAKSLEPKGIKLKALPRNPVDRIWGRERPAPPQGAVVPASHEVCRQAGRAEDRRAAGGAAQGRRGRRHPHAARLHRLAAQHPRLGRGAQSGSAGVSRSCRRAARWNSSSIRPR